jgi:hypothetical protein
MEPENEFIEHDISSLEKFQGIPLQLRKDQESLAESLASSNLVFEQQVSKAHDLFVGNYEAFMDSLCYAKFENIELNKVIQNYQRDKCRGLPITAQVLNTTTMGKLRAQFQEKPAAELEIVLKRKEAMKKYLQRNLELSLKRLKDTWVRV